MENKLYCIRYRNICKPYYGYIKPWNAVRDTETYSLTYLVPSFINGIEQELGIEGKILRHKLKYQIVLPKFIKNKKNKIVVNGDFSKAVTYGKNSSTHKRHCLTNPEIIFAFDNKEDAEYALTQPLCFGQIQYTIYPDITFGEKGIQIMTNEEFDDLVGVETFTSNEDEGIYVGNNRQKNNERMYVNIIRKFWDNED